MWIKIQDKAKNELLHAIFMIKVVFADEKDIPSLDEVSPDTFFTEEIPSILILNRWKLVIDLYKENDFI